MWKKLFGSPATASILQQPSAEQSVCAGQTATLSIITGGTGAPLKYEWQFSPDLTSGWLAITEPRFEGASSPQLTVQKVQSSDGGHYRCVVHQQARNQQSLISDTVKLTVVSSPVVSGPANVEEHVIVGRDASLCVEASEEGGSLSYQWQWKPVQEPTVGARGGGEGREGGDEEGKGEASSVHVTTPENALDDFYPTLRQHFNVQSAFPYLRQHRLITADQQEKLMLPSTNAERVDQLMVWLPHQGKGYLEKFIRCLKESASDVPVHNEVAEKLEKALSRRHSTARAENISQERSQNVRVVATEEWTSLCDDGRIQGSQDPCLSVGQVCESDAGTYRCQVSNMAGTTLSGTVELVVVGVPKIIGNLEDVKAAPNDHVTLDVKAVGGGELTYTWERKQENSTEWQAVSMDGGRYQGQGTSSLTLVGVEPDDMGVFRCHVSSEAGKTWTKEVVLTVEDPVKIKLHPTDTSVVVSKTLTLCVEANCSVPLTYTWQKKSTGSKGDAWEPLSTAPSNTNSAMFSLKEVTESDAGEFRCVVRSKTGASAVSQPATITVLTIEQVVSEFIKKCKTVQYVGDLVASFTKEHGSSSQVTKAVLLALVQGETDSHEVIKAMLDFSVSLDVQQDGFGLLHWACMRGHAKSVEVLLDHGVEVNPHTKENRVSSPLHLAAESGHCEIMTLLLKRCSETSFINARDKMGQTALHVAIKAIGACSPEDEQHLVPKLTEAIRVLLDNHARTDIQDLDTQTPLHLAASSGHQQVMRCLLERDRNAIISCDNGRNTALHIACCERNVHCASAILDYPEGRRIINEQNEDGNTALHLACAGGYKEICNLLLRKGANRSIKNKTGRTPEAMSRTGFQLAEGQRHFTMGSYPTRPITENNDNTFRARSATPPCKSTRPMNTSLPGKDDLTINSDSYETDPLPGYSEREVQVGGTQGRLKHETIGELLCMDQDMSGFKGTLPDYQNRVQLSAPHRELVKQGPLVKYSRKTTCQRFFFLFSDVLIHTEELGGGRYSFKNAMPLHYMLVKEQSAHSDSTLCFDVLTVTRSLLLMAKSLAEKNEWLEVLGKCIGDYNLAIGKDPLQCDQDLRHKPIFEPDDNVTKCQNCAVAFTFINRKHHCRQCGKAVCNTCSRGRAQVTHKDSSVRVCKECLKSKPSMQDEAAQVERGVLERQAGSVENTLKRGHVTCLQTNTRMWYELDPDGALYIYKAAKDVFAEKSLPIFGYQLLTNQKKKELKLSHRIGSVVFSVDDLKEFNQWKSALEKVLSDASAHAQ